jgi:hypothetical protein
VTTATRARVDTAYQRLREHFAYLAIETFLPADAASAARLRELADQDGIEDCPASSREGQE